MSRKHIGVLGAVALALAMPGTASAAAPDGSGPWADSVLAAQQGQRANGTPVLAVRSNPTSALGVAENTNAEGSFYSLGFGGRIDLGFENNVCNGAGDDLDLQLVEATNEPYPAEIVDVYVSANGTDWVAAASNVNKDATVGLPASVPIAHFVRLVDRTDASVSRANADGYDVDGVKALHTDCKPNQPPDCSKVSAGPNLWPPNHKFRKVTLSGLTDPDGDAVTLTITGVTQDEPLNALGDGNFAPDAILSGNDLQLRAERSGLGDGRVYRIAFTGSDGNGGTCSGVATVGVPHDQGAHDTPIDSGGVYNSLG
jgi:hypothetical protein